MILLRLRALLRLSGGGCVECPWAALGKGGTTPAVGVVTADVTTDDGFDGVSVSGSTFGERSTPSCSNCSVILSSETVFDPRLKSHGVELPDCELFDVVLGMLRAEFSCLLIIFRRSTC